MATVNIQALGPRRSWKIQSKGLIHIVYARTRMRAMRKGREWFNTTAVRIINSKQE